MDQSASSAQSTLRDAWVLQELERRAIDGKNKKEKELGKRYLREHSEQVDSCHHSILRQIKDLLSKWSP
jgi:hypothetical protein